MKKLSSNRCCCCSGPGNDNRYASLADQLRQRIVELKIKIDRQLRLLEALKVQIKSQFISVQRLEVNIYKYTIKNLPFNIIFIFFHNSK